MSKIIILANNSGGLYDFRKELISELISRGNTVIAYTPFDTNLDDLRGLGLDLREIQIDRRGINPKTDLRLFKEFCKIVKSEKPDLVITYTIKPNVYGGMACRRYKVPYAINITGLGTAFQNPGLVKTIATTLYKVACKKAKVVFFENAGNREIFVESKIVETDRTHVLNGAGVNTEYFSVQEYPDSAVTKFLFVGRIMQEKGMDELLEAMKRLVADGEHVELHVVGGYEESYKEIIGKYQNEGWLFYHGYQLDVRPFIGESSCFVLPSWHEGMANTNLECAASGRPVITSKIHGCMEAVEDGVSGYLAKCKDVDSLYEKMKQFMGLSFEQRRDMGLAGRKRMEEIFDKKAVVEDTINYL